MAKIRFSLANPDRAYYGNRVEIIEEPELTDTPGKKKARLRDNKRRNKEQIMPTRDANPENVRVSRANWLGRRERGEYPN